MGADGSWITEFPYTVVGRQEEHLAEWQGAGTVMCMQRFNNHADLELTNDGQGLYISLITRYNIIISC